MLNITHYQRNANQNYNEVPSCTSQNAAVAAAKSLQSYPALCDPIDCSPPGSSVHGSSLGKNTGSDIIREMQIKTTMRYHLTPVRMAAIKKSTMNAGEGAEKREPSYIIGGNAN